MVRSPRQPGRGARFVALLLFASLAVAPPVAAATPADPVWRQGLDPSEASGEAHPVGSTVATVLIAGDIAGCTFGGDLRTARLVESLPGLVMTAGDNVYPSGTAAQFRDCYAPTWGRFRDRTRPVPGNHDWMTAGAAGYFGYFGKRAGPAGRGYYAFDLGAWRVYALAGDCGAVGGCGSGSPQYDWLVADLATRPHACVMAVWHQPRFSSGPHGGTSSVRPLLRTLYRAGAELVVNGHDHTYERFAPARPNGTPDAVRGIRQFVVGTGGAPLYTFDATPAPNSEVRDRSSHGILRLTLGAGGFAWEFLPVPGDTFTDSGRGTCH